MAEMDLFADERAADLAEAEKLRREIRHNEYYIMYWMRRRLRTLNMTA